MIHLITLFNKYKKNHDFFFTITLVFLLIPNFLISQELITGNKRDHPETILFVGNSYLYYNDSLHNHFKQMVEEHLTGCDGGVLVKSATIGRSRLKHHDVERLIKFFFSTF